MSKTHKIPRPFVIVGGLAEYRAFSITHGKHFVRQIPGCHASQPISPVAERIATLVRLAKNYTHVLIVLDREQSPKSSIELEAELCAAIKSHLPNDEIVAACPDTMIENWMLADVESWRHHKYIRNTAKQRKFEGKHGKKEIKRLFVQNRSYGETTHGVLFLGLIRSTQASSNSDSYKRFAKTTPR